MQNFDVDPSFSPKTEEEYRKLSYMFPEYIFLDDAYCIRLAGRSIEELLNYGYGELRDKSINLLSEKDDLKSSFMIQIAENFFEWRSYSLKAKNAQTVQVEICGFRMTGPRDPVAYVAMRVRNSRSHLERACIPELDRLTYWMSHNLRGPIATIEGLINLAKTEQGEGEMETYLNYLSLHAQRLDEKVQLMMRITDRVMNSMANR